MYLAQDIFFPIVLYREFAKRLIVPCKLETTLIIIKRQDDNNDNNIVIGVTIMMIMIML